MISESLLNEWVQIDVTALAHAPDWVRELYETEVKPYLKKEEKPACDGLKGGSSWKMEKT